MRIDMKIDINKIYNANIVLKFFFLFCKNCSFCLYIGRYQSENLCSIRNVDKNH